MKNSIKEPIVWNDYKFSNNEILTKKVIVSKYDSQGLNQSDVGVQSEALENRTKLRFELHLTTTLACHFSKIFKIASFYNQLKLLN
jgi:hypothetical protein